MNFHETLGVQVFAEGVAKAGLDTEDALGSSGAQIDNAIRHPRSKAYYVSSIAFGTCLRLRNLRFMNGEWYRFSNFALDVEFMDGNLDVVNRCTNDFPLLRLRLLDYSFNEDHRLDVDVLSPIHEVSGYITMLLQHALNGHRLLAQDEEDQMSAHFPYVMYACSECDRLAEILRGQVLQSGAMLMIPLPCVAIGVRIAVLGPDFQRLFSSGALLKLVALL